MNGTAGIINSGDGVMQGDPLSMITYRIGILALIKNIKMEIPDFTQTWYADNAGALGTFAIIETYFYSLTRKVPGQGYHPADQ